MTVALGLYLIVAPAESAFARCPGRMGSVNPAITLTAKYSASSADRQRAALIVRIVRATLQRYRRRSLVENTVYLEHAIAAGRYRRVLYPADSPLSLFSSFDFEIPSALLYTHRSSSKGAAVVVGAVYTVNAAAPASLLNVLVPRGIARWEKVEPRCMPGSPWTLEVFPFERDPERIWQLPNSLSTR